MWFLDEYRAAMASMTEPPSMDALEEEKPCTTCKHYDDFWGSCEEGEDPEKCSGVECDYCAVIP